MGVSVYICHYLRRPGSVHTDNVITSDIVTQPLSPIQHRHSIALASLLPWINIYNLAAPFNAPSAITGPFGACGLAAGPGSRLMATAS